MKRNKMLQDAMEYVNKLLLPLEGLYYHQYNHSLEVMNRCIYLGEKEKVTSEEVEILALAGLFHDTGFVIQYDNNEFIGAKIAQNYLKSILYPNHRIQIVESLINATIPSYKNPKNILEKIIKDADLDNLGREDFFELNHNIRKEIETIKQIKMKDPNWMHASLCLIQEYDFYTPTQQKERGEQKKENRKILEAMMNELNIPE